MKLEVEVISKEIIKPSSPTSDRLRHYQFSFLDQLTPSIYNPLVMFYPVICDTQANKIKISNHLKQSISDALTYCYPLAGRIMEDQLFVDCNDEGIPFLEAKVKCQLSDFVQNPVPCELNKLLPFKVHDAKEIVMGIQLNVFDCGGIGIAVCISHKIGDALSFFTFVNLWSAIARGEKKLVVPEFESASLFPPRNLSGYSPPSISQMKERVITKRFLFSASNIEQIRGKYADNFENQTRPTRVEALSAFLWTRYITAIGIIRSRPDTFLSITHLVNIRNRMDPPQPGNLVGNLCCFAITFPSMDITTGESCHNIVTQIRDSIKKINKEYVKKIQYGYNLLDYIRDKASSYAKGETLSFAFTSLCRFPVYEADFGWGKPIWVGSAAQDVKNVVVFLDTRVGNGIEAWVSLQENDMAKFDSDEELLAYIDAPKSV